MEIVAPFNNIIVSIERKYIRNFTSLLRMAAIQNLTSIEPADYVNIIGKVVSIPKAISNRREYKGYKLDNIKVGDTVIFSHMVIYSFIQTNPNAEPIYRNLFWYKGKEYWTCDILNLFASIRNEKIIMHNGYVMVEKLEKPSKIFLPVHVKKQINTAKAVVTQVAENTEVCVGDTVYFNPSIIQIFQINEKPFGILRRKDILGFKVPDYSTHQFLN